ncbi:MAG: hypothetical protein ACUVTZ_06090 [Armatimonadota bacterium]
MTANAGDFGLEDMGAVAGSSSDLRPSAVRGEVALSARLIGSTAVIRDLVLTAHSIPIEQMKALEPGELVTAAAGDGAVWAGGPSVPCRRHDVAVEAELRVGLDVMVDPKGKGNEDGGRDDRAGNDDAPCPGACQR